nr:hypothetical protein CFP56_71738 [Quercus suber]
MSWIQIDLSNSGSLQPGCHNAFWEHFVSGEAPRSRDQAVEDRGHRSLGKASFCAFMLASKIPRTYAHTDGKVCPGVIFNIPAMMQQRLKHPEVFDVCRCLYCIGSHTECVLSKELLAFKVPVSNGITL